MDNKRKKSLLGWQIRDLLQGMRLQLYLKNFDAHYFRSVRGVPCVYVILESERYQFCYFGKGNFFRVFDPKQNRKDFGTRDEVFAYFEKLRKDLKEPSHCEE